jgi:hypothetical protein
VSFDRPLFLWSIRKVVKHSPLIQLRSPSGRFFAVRVSDEASSKAGKIASPIAISCNEGLTFAWQFYTAVGLPQQGQHLEL